VAVKRPSIHQLEVFCRIVQLESMARAAEELQVAPSSVSMQVQELERRYRTKLLVRGPRRTTPTPAGAALYKQVLALLQGLDAVEREIARLQHVERGTLRFASSRTIGAGLVRRVLQAFERAHPEVDISYSIMKSSQSAKAEVLEERAEFALVGRVGPGWPLEVKPLFQEAMVVAVAPDHPLAAEARPDVDALARHVLLLREPPVLGHKRILGMLEDAGVRPEICELGSTEAVKSEAVAGRGVAVLPRTTVADEIAAGTLRACEVAGFRPQRTVYLTWLSRTPLSPVAESFVRLVRGLGEGDQPLERSA
jgi:LysR family transcriptional regulator, low CO2-responsive transcriptional regulator